MNFNELSSLTISETTLKLDIFINNRSKTTVLTGYKNNADLSLFLIPKHSGILECTNPTKTEETSHRLFLLRVEKVLRRVS